MPAAGQDAYIWSTQFGGYQIDEFSSANPQRAITLDEFSSTGFPVWEATNVHGTEMVHMS